MELNLNLSAVPSTSSSMPKLKAYEIHRVKLANVKVETIKGKKDPDAIFEILKVRFETDKAYYEESIFFPKESDTKRPTRENKEGHTIEMPSNFERTMSFISQLGTVIAPKEFEKMKGLPFKSFAELCAALIKILTPHFGKTETNLKLIGRTDKEGNFSPCLPYFVALNKKGEIFVSDNFIGETLFFTEYELKKQKEVSDKKPTTMDSDKDTKEKEEQTDTSDIDAINFDDLE